MSRARYGRFSQFKRPILGLVNGGSGSLAPFREGFPIEHDYPWNEHT
jgi:hypothetical protein